MELDPEKKCALRECDGWAEGMAVPDDLERGGITILMCETHRQGYRELFDRHRYEWVPFSITPSDLNG